MDTVFISGTRTLDARFWTLDLCSLLVDYGHVVSGLWIWDSGPVVLDTSLSEIVNQSPVIVGSILNSPPGLSCIVMYNCALQTILQSSTFTITDNTSRRGGEGVSVDYNLEGLQVVLRNRNHHGFYNFHFILNFLFLMNLFADLFEFFKCRLFLTCS